MGIVKWADKTAKKMKWYDISLVKLTVFFLTLFLMTAWTSFRNLVLSFGWYWYLLIAIICMVPLARKIFY